MSIETDIAEMKIETEPNFFCGAVELTLSHKTKPDCLKKDA